MAADAAEQMAEHLEERLKWFRARKFGLMMHWGPYSQLGCIESWPLSEEDTWARPGWEGDFEEFTREYRALNQTFDPVDFDPHEWATVGAEAGAEYFVFTTKHHDGFNMYDTHESEYKVTAPSCPHHAHRFADVTGSLFEAFRRAGLSVGAYYSKADWHSPYYWHPKWPARNRRANYDPAEHPELWEAFVGFVHRQIRELMTRYGPIDILWLDAGWVRPPREDPRMDELVAMARSHQPGLIVADRTVGGPHENYKTPEKQVPAAPMDEPWETAMTMGERWSYRPDETYKSERELIQMLVDVVGKGGNLLLNVGPGPDGKLPEAAVKRLRAMGEWMRVNREALVDTEMCRPYRQGPWAFTRRGATAYALYLPEGGEQEDGENGLPQRVILPLEFVREAMSRDGGLPSVGEVSDRSRTSSAGGRSFPSGGSPEGSSDLKGQLSVELLGSPGRLSCDQTDVGVQVEIPQRLVDERRGAAAYAFRIRR